MKKMTFDFLFIVISAGILTVLEIFGFLDRLKFFALIPILIAYYLGQFSQKKFGSNK